MNQSPAGSFLRFFVGFTVFISISFGVTYGVQTYAEKQDAAKLQAAALEALFGREK